MALPTPDFLLLKLRLNEQRPSKRFGQNYLKDSEILERIAAAVEPDPAPTIIEIGPGPGTLTTLLAARAHHLLAIEFDTRFTGHHGEVFGNESNIEFLYHDALRVDLEALARERMAENGRAVLAGNLPFQITSPLLFGQCHPDVLWSQMVFMVQKEVADRIASRHNCKNYGILTIKLDYFWQITERFEVPSRHFVPRPKVDTSVLVFAPRPDAERPDAEEWAGLSRFIDAAFNQRRKKLVNSLAGTWGGFPGKEPFLAILESMEIDPLVRAEALTPEQLRELHRSCAQA